MNYQPLFTVPFLASRWEQEFREFQTSSEAGALLERLKNNDSFISKFSLASPCTTTSNVAMWGRLAKILSAENVTPKIMGSIYKTVVQSILLYGSETWVLNKMMIRKLDSFHRRCARYIAREHIRQNEDGTWTYPSSERVLEKAGLLPITEYIRRRQITVVPFAQSNQIFMDCNESVPIARNYNQKTWWNMLMNVM